eukprot:jgi/Chrzof1/12493/Cz06g36080.t1
MAATEGTSPALVHQNHDSASCAIDNGMPYPCHTLLNDSDSSSSSSSSNGQQQQQQQQWQHSDELLQ